MENDKKNVSAPWLRSMNLKKNFKSHPMQQRTYKIIRLAISITHEGLETMLLPNWVPNKNIAQLRLPFLLKAKVVISFLMRVELRCRRGPPVKIFCNRAQGSGKEEEKKRRKSDKKSWWTKLYSHKYEGRSTNARKIVPISTSFDQ